MPEPDDTIEARYAKLQRSYEILLAELARRTATLEQMDRLLFLIDRLVTLINSRPATKDEIPQLAEILRTRLTEGVISSFRANPSITISTLVNLSGPNGHGND
jgi:hypothetical protein